MSKCIHQNCQSYIYDIQSQKCIFHCEKDDWFHINDKNELVWDQEKVTLFWHQINQYIKPYYANVSLAQKIDSPILTEVLSVGNGKSKKFIALTNIIIPSLENTDNFESIYEYYYFDNCTFVGDFKISLKLEDNHLKKDLNFSQSTFNGKFIIESDSAGIDGNIKFAGTKHFDDISFEGDYFKSIQIKNINHNYHHNKSVNIYFSPSLLLRHMTFDNLIFSHLDKSKIDNIFIGYAKVNHLFFGETIDGVCKLNSFKIKKSEINKCNISDLCTNELILEDITFKDNSQINIINIETNNLIINELYQNSEFINLNQITVKEIFKCNKAELFGVIFDNFDVSNAKTKEILKTSFSGSHLNSVNWGNINEISSSRDIFRQLKSLNDEKANYVDANNFFVKEMKEYKKELSNYKLVSNWWEEKIVFFLNELISDFGRSWFQSLIWFFFISLIFFNLIEALKQEYDNSFYIVNIGLLAIILWAVKIIINKLRFKINFIPHIISIIYLYCLPYGNLNDISNFVNPASYDDYKDNFASLWALHKAFLSVIIYHFTISLRRQTKR